MIKLSVIKMNLEEYELKIMQSPNDFWIIYDRLEEDESELIYDRSFILTSFIEKKMLCLRNDQILPCFVIFGDEADLQMIWVHSKLRNKGVASFIVKKLNPEKIVTPLFSAMDFWFKLGYTKKHDGYLTR
jgi:hypothetical protein